MLTRGWALWKCHCEEDKKKSSKNPENDCPHKYVITRNV